MTSGKDRWNENVLRCRRNECSDWADVTSLGRLFHTQRAATGIARLLTDDSLTCGTIRRSDCWLQGVNITGQNNTRAKTAVTWQLRDKETSCTFWVKHFFANVTTYFLVARLGTILDAGRYGIGLGVPAYSLNPVASRWDYIFTVLLI